MKRALILVALALLPLPALAQSGPSFDCRQARAWDERQICAQADLAELDRRIAAAWRAVTANLPPEQRAQLQADQRSWLADRRRCEGPQAREAQSCLRRVMRVRARDLEAMTQTAALPATKPAPAVPPPPATLRAVTCPGTPGWVAAQVCATPGMRDLDAAVIRDAEAARSRLARNPAALVELETLLARYVAARDACAQSPGRLPLDCLQETMEDAQAEIRRRAAG